MTISTVSRLVLRAARDRLDERSESLRSIGVELFGAERRCVVWADLLEQTVDSQLRAVEAFFAVQEAFEDELQLELRFGDLREHLMH